MLEALLRGMGWDVSDMERYFCQLRSFSSSEDMEVDGDGDQDHYLESMELIPGLPEDIALECLLKVSYKCHPCLRKVCRRWEKEVTDPVFYWERKKAGTTRHCVCMVQALPEAPGGMNNKPKDAAATTVYGISMYDLEQRTWERLPMIPDFPQGLPFFCRLMSLHGKLIVLGGWHPSTWEALRSTYVFTFSTQRWSRGADMPRVRSFFACGVIGSSILVAGGHDDNKTALSTADVYNLETDRWETLPNMSEERDECAGVVLDGKFFVISGYGTNSQGQFVSSADIFDPATGNWSRVNEMWTMGGGSCLSGGYAVARGELYAFQRQSLVRYCPLRNAWSVVDTVIPEATRVSLCATAVNDQLLFVMGSGSCKAECRGLIYRPSPSPSQEENNNNEKSCGIWQTIEFSEEFSGVAQSSCSVEI
ncbi:hypothetical protein CY35_14G022900 [Sphagnum magellanicum]|jgi:hypothetical protein|nr:hypothetical protein CY35_14G022900 [Sphagnum magellanicum]